MGSFIISVAFPKACNFMKYEFFPVEDAFGRLQPASVELRSKSLQRQTRISSLLSNVNTSGKRHKRFDKRPRGKWICQSVNSLEDKDGLLQGGDAESQLLEQLRQAVQQQGGDIESADDMELLRFLRGKSMDVEKTAAAYVRHQKWKAEFIPNGGFTEADLPTELAAKKSYIIAQDKKGRPVSLTLGRNHVYNKDFTEFKRFAIYVFEQLVARAPPGTQDFLYIIDLKALGVKNLDSKSFVAGFDLLQNHYPGRIDKVYMVNVPLIFNGLWKVVSKLLDENTKRKIIFVDNKKLTETLLEEIDIDHLPKEYGGNAELVLVQELTARQHES
ncbi:hypothetical protein R1sor_006885 [Riccia sorocarpa]|uniref:CRAL-TRIO domain-containing protein n=1 Tax=Riccia sorocarpa TaxID=122646 RepID=A0ABD3HRP9_9MARC